MGNIVAAIKARYNNPAEIDSIDIGFIGSYGEWNFSGTSPQVSYPAAADLQTFMDDWLPVNSQVPFIMGGDLHSQGTLAEWQHAMGDGYGWRVDCWGAMSRLTSSILCTFVLLARC